MATPAAIARAQSLVRWRPCVAEDGTTTYIVSLHMGGDALQVGKPQPSRIAADVAREMIALELAEHFDAAAREAARIAASRVRPKPHFIGGF